MHCIALKLDRAGFNPQVMSLFIAFAAMVAWLVMPCITPVQHWNGVLEVDLKTLSNFDFNPVEGQTSDIPRWIRELDGKRVALEGFMLAWRGGAERPRSFNLIYTTSPGSGWPRLQDRVLVSNPKSLSASYSTDEVRVTGILHVRAERDSGLQSIECLFEMDLDRVEPL